MSEKPPASPKAPPSQLSKSMAYLEKRFGKGIVMALDGVVDKRPCIPSGHPFIDYVMGGGFFFGKHIELYGYESAGKSTLAYTVAINCQKMKFNTGRVLLIDVENAFSKTYFKSLGGLVDPEHLLVSQPDTAEDAMEIMREFVDNELVDLIIVDSVSALLPKAEEGIFVDTSGKEVESGKGTQKGQMGAGRIGSQSLMMSQSLKQLSPRINNAKVCVIWINQIRTKIETSGNRQTTDTTSGGNALRFYTSVRLELRKIGAVKGDIFSPFENKWKPGIVAVKTVVKGAKNKMAPPFREAPITMRFGTGIDVEDGILEFACNQKIISKGVSGWYSTKDIGATRNARGLDDFRALMKAEPKIWEWILSKCDFEKAMDGTATQALLAEHNTLPEGFSEASASTAAELLDGPTESGEESAESSTTEQPTEQQPESQSEPAPAVSLGDARSVVTSLG